MTFGTTPKDNAQVPLGSVYVPNTASSDLTALEGIAINTDGNSQKSSAARMGMLDGDHVSFGAKADAVATSDTGTFTLLALFKRLLGKWSAGTGTKANVASSASSVTILAANTARKGAIIYNDSTQVLYLDLTGGTASNSSYSVQVPSQGYFEVPGPSIYTGAITGIWAAANGNARVTEFS